MANTLAIILAIIWPKILKQERVVEEELREVDKFKRK
jgi:hypothetical protein